jgi:dolichol-phosphate mannosyltransferase
MSDQAVLTHGRRVRAGLRKPANWLQLVRFGLVGASGYAVNLAVFAACVHGLRAAPAVAATVAFLVAVTNNFLWNRGWTFRGHGGAATHQAARFLAVSLAGFGWNLVALALLIAAGLPSVPAQAIAIATATPLTFLGNKLWTFDA